MEREIGLWIVSELVENELGLLFTCQFRGYPLLKRDKLFWIGGVYFHGDAHTLSRKSRKVLALFSFFYKDTIYHACHARSKVSKRGVSPRSSHEPWNFSIYR